MNIPNIIILLGIVFIFLFGALWHFVYILAQKNKIIGLIAPINESVFEHLKLSVVPTIIYWIIMYFILDKYNINPNEWFLAMLISILSAIITMPSIYYLYSQGLGIKNLIVDIILFLVVTAIGQTVAYFVYINNWNIPYPITLILLSFIIISFGLLTYFPPKLPIFCPPSN